MTRRFLFIGGDRRILYAMDRVSQKYPTDCIGLGGECPPPVGMYDRIVLPFPSTRDGEHINAPLSDAPLAAELITQYAADNAVVFSGGSARMIQEECERGEITLCDYSLDETLTQKNALLTAQAAAAILSQSTDGALCGSRTLITGYGRVAGHTAALLRAFGTRITIAARSPQARSLAELEGFETVAVDEMESVLSGMDFVVNTVPAALFGAEMFSLMKRGAVFQELATLPAEPCRSLADKAGITYIHSAGLPGKASPKTAGELIGEYLLDHAEKP